MIALISSGLEARQIFAAELDDSLCLSFACLQPACLEARWVCLEEIFGGNSLHRPYVDGIDAVDIIDGILKFDSFTWFLMLKKYVAKLYSFVIFCC